MQTRKAIHDQVFEEARIKARPVSVFLKNGVSIKGKVLAHDPYILFMETDKEQVIVYKHSITSILSRTSSPDRKHEEA